MNFNFLRGVKPVSLPLECPTIGLHWVLPMGQQWGTIPTWWNRCDISSFKHFIGNLFEQLKSNWHGISIPPRSCSQCRLRPITSKLISPQRARKYHAIRENSRGKWLPSLNDCVATKQAFCIILLRFILRSNSIVSFELWALAILNTIVVSHRE